MTTTTAPEPGPAAGAPPAPPPPHAIEAAAVAARLGVDPDRGLAPDVAAERLARLGPNRLDETPPRSPVLLFLDQFKNLLILILIGAAVIAATVGDVKDPIVIGVVVLFNAVLGFLQEFRAERSLAALKQMMVTTARVRRAGRVEVVAAEELVPGDVVLVGAGDRVPADGRWIATVDLEVDESAFTGESAPVAKHTDALPEPTPLADRRGSAFMNTTATRGRGELVVTATGMATEIGRLAAMLQDADSGPTPLQRQINDLGKRLTIVAGVAVGAVFALGLARDLPLADKVLNAVALAVAAIPEGLPAVLTVTLAVGTAQLAKRGAIVKRLASVETLGCTTVICSDKTGTLTVNQMTARALWTAEGTARVSGEGYRSEGDVVGDIPLAALRHLLLPAVLCNDAEVRDGVLLGDPTEGALVVLGVKGGVDVDAELVRHRRIAEIPFDSVRKLMATFHEAPEGVLVCVKGAPDVLLDHCRAVAGAGPLDAALRARLLEETDRLAADGLRVLAVAARTLTASPAALGGEDLLALVDDLELRGFVGLQDPPRPEARDAIALCHRAGVHVKMITGDHARTAASIARQLGIEGEVVTGAQLDEMDAAGLRARVGRIGVFARVAPEHKVAIVQALRGNGEIVAMTGDGVNDAPALRNADIGVAMGITGTDVTKEAATMVLTDDNFATIVRAVRGGRAIYDNIVKFVRFQLSTNFGAILTILTASLLLWPEDGRAFFTPIAILWVNLIMDGPPAMALGLDPPGPDVMRRPPRDPAERVLSLPRIARLLGLGAVMAAATLAVFAWAGGPSASGAEAARASTMAFTTFVFLQMFNIFNARNERVSAFGRHAFANGKLWLALAAVIVLQVVAATWGPLQQLVTGLEVTGRLSALDWLVVVVAASSILWLEELAKLLRHRR